MNKQEAIAEVIRLMRAFHITTYEIQMAETRTRLAPRDFEVCDSRTCRCNPPCKVGYCNKPQL